MKQTVVADDSVKEANAELTILQNDIAKAKEELEQVQKRRAVIDEEILKKTSDAQIWLNTQRADVAKMQKEVSEERKKITEAKGELQKQVESLGIERMKVQKERAEVDADKRKVASQQNRFANFVIAVERAYSLVK